MLVLKQAMVKLSMGLIIHPAILHQVTLAVRDLMIHDHRVHPGQEMHKYYDRDDCSGFSKYSIITAIEASSHSNIILMYCYHV
jgi:hypothetical protein